jgi:hypothetical protein
LSCKIYFSKATKNTASIFAFCSILYTFALVQTEKVITDANGLTQLNTEKLSDGFYHLRIKSNLGELGKTFGISR